ncbi:hypothetical protein ACIRU3_26145 [Streptomyces sp. NPDC101151]|uniref:hypothetical protein n=1 Tax=Streptomyces sp. NPDC101151 TaxID=3366115 RepID=UPI00381D1E7E
MPFLDEFFRMNRCAFADALRDDKAGRYGGWTPLDYLETFVNALLPKGSDDEVWMQRTLDGNSVGAWIFDWVNEGTDIQKTYNSGNQISLGELNRNRPYWLNNFREWLLVHARANA